LRQKHNSQNLPQLVGIAGFAHFLRFIIIFVVVVVIGHTDEGIAAAVNAQPAPAGLLDHAD
jgi:hypothetical protein